MSQILLVDLNLLATWTVENLLRMLWSPACESLGDWIFLISLVFGECNLRQLYSDAYWYWSMCSFPFFWSIINCFQNPRASCSCPSRVRKVRTWRWNTLPSAHHLSGKMWKRNPDYFIVKACYRPHSYLGTFTISFQSLDFFFFCFSELERKQCNGFVHICSTLSQELAAPKQTGWEWCIFWESVVFVSGSFGDTR